MSAETALQRLAEQVSLICSEHRRLKKLCARLEKQVQKLSRSAGRKGRPPKSGSDGVEGLGGAPVDKEKIKEKVEEMLAELADIG